MNQEKKDNLIIFTIIIFLIIFIVFIIDFNLSNNYNLNAEFKTLNYNYDWLNENSFDKYNKSYYNPH